MSASAQRNPCSTAIDVEGAVRHRYSRAASRIDATLCCPVEYEPKYLRNIPQEILDRDYGCGDPSKHVEEGESVLDLGSGSGKICYIAAQIVGPSGRVIGIDCNDEMLSLARRCQPTVAARLGYDVVAFHKGQIQDLKLDLARFERRLAEHPVRTSGDWLSAEEHARHLRATEPMVPDASIDVVVSNCVLNLVRSEDRRQLFAEVARVLRPGGRAVISDIISDEDVPLELQNNPELWSGCISGAYREDLFLAAFEDAGFFGIEIVARQREPWAVANGIEFRSVTVKAWKKARDDERDCLQAAIYHGPWKIVIDEAGNHLRRGERIAVGSASYAALGRAPYSDQLTLVPAKCPIDPSGAPLFSPHQADRIPGEATDVRAAAETKRGAPRLTVLPASGCCGPESACGDA